MSTLEEPYREAVGGDVWSDEFARTLESHRERARQLLQSERERIRRVETTLSDQMQLLAAELTQDRAQATRRDDELSRRTLLLDDKATQLEQLRCELTNREQQWQRQQSDLTAQHQSWLGELRLQHQQLETKREDLLALERQLAQTQAAFEARQLEFGQREQSLTLRAQQLDDQATRLTQTQNQCESTAASLHEQMAALQTEHLQISAAQNRLEHERRTLAQQQQETSSQRRRIARELRSQRTEMLAEIERRQAEMLQISSGGEAQLRAQLSTLASQADDLRRQLLERDAREQELQDQLELIRSQASQLQQDQQLRDDEITTLRAWLAERDADAAGLEQLKEQHEANVAHLQLELEEQRRQAEQLRWSADSLQQQLAQNQQATLNDRSLADEQRLQADRAATEVRRLTEELEEVRRRAANELAAVQASNNLALDEQIRQLNDQLTFERREREAGHQTAQRLQTELEARQIELAQLGSEAQQRLAELAKLHEESQQHTTALAFASDEQNRQRSYDAERFAADLLQRDAALQELEAERLARQAEFDSLQGELAAKLAEIARRDQDHKQDLANWQQQRAALEGERATLQARQHSHDSGHANELETLREQLHSAQMDATRVANELEQLRAEQGSILTSGQVALAQSRNDQDELRQQLTAMRSELEQARHELALAQSHDSTADVLASARWEAEKAELLSRLEAAECQLAAGTSDGAESQMLEDLRRRYEMSVEDLRELKNKNNDLTQAVARLKASGGAAANANSGAMDWESQKRRMLEQLDQDFDDNNEQQKQEKLTIDEAIRTANLALEERQQEILELKQLLDQQSNNLGNVAVGAAAIAEMLNQDELVAQEREALTKLQEEWREKLKKAEVDISLERAKLARQRNALEEKIQQLEEERARFTPEPSSTAAGDKSNKPQRGRWLARLGLKEEDQQGGGKR
ncbi:MAG TPA: hypothetical protein VL096_14790 [Pirellulaceae bacterium]|nr:hypothetical protein [Pirellulaceae bacterium]